MFDLNGVVCYALVFCFSTHLRGVSVLGHQSRPVAEAAVHVPANSIDAPRKDARIYQQHHTLGLQRWARQAGMYREREGERDGREGG